MGNITTFEINVEISRSIYIYIYVWCREKKIGVIKSECPSMYGRYITIV